MVTSETDKPTIDYFGVVEWERDLDPWHAGAFPVGLQYAGTTGERAKGWMGCDWCGNPLIFIPDGTEL